MTFLDLLSLIFDNLGRRKARVALTAVGVVIGTAAVVVLVSLGIGQQRNATEQLYGIGDLSLINVEPNYGEQGMPEASVAKVGGGGSGGAASVQTLITDETIAQLTAIPGVATVMVRDWLQASAIIYVDRLESWVGITGVSTPDLSVLDLEPQGGTLALEKGTAIAGAYVNRNFYNPRWRPGMPEVVPPDLLNATTKMVLIKYGSDGTEIKKSVPLRITGVIAESSTEADYSIYMRLEDVTAYNEWASGRRINRSKEGYPMALVKAAEVDQVLEIADQIEALGYRVYTQQRYVQGINSFYILQQVIFGGVGATALLVAAIGIANTMAMAILERTREIGLMKAVGATNRDVLSIFLGEASGIGFIGGLGGVLLGWSAGQIINVVALAYLAGQSATTGAPPPTVAVYTPLWLPAFALFFATLIGLLSGLYPALRAATLVPVNALKYE